MHFFVHPSYTQFSSDSLRVVLRPNMLGYLDRCVFFFLWLLFIRCCFLCVTFFLVDLSVFLVQVVWLVISSLVMSWSRLCPVSLGLAFVCPPLLGQSCLHVCLPVSLDMCSCVPLVPCSFALSHPLLSHPHCLASFPWVSSVCVQLYVFLVLPLLDWQTDYAQLCSLLWVVPSFALVAIALIPHCVLPVS